MRATSGLVAFARIALTALLIIGVTAFATYSLLLPSDPPSLSSTRAGQQHDPATCPTCNASLRDAASNRTQTDDGTAGIPYKHTGKPSTLSDFAP